jgi:hypothetical protein
MEPFLGRVVFLLPLGTCAHVGLGMQYLGNSFG